MKKPVIHERLAEKLFSSSARKKLGMAAICFLLASPLMWMNWDFDEKPELPHFGFELREPDSQVLSPQTPSAEKIPDHVRRVIDNLFQEIEKNPDLKEKLLRELRRVLQESFAGQEDCWSCEGTAYFDRFDQIAGKGEARKPIGLREWIEQGDEAYESSDHDQARRYYTKALQVMDERMLQPEDSVDESLIEKLQNRCLELDCR